MLDINTAEKIETIIFSFLHHRTASGAFGSIVQADDGSYSVTADGRAFAVHCGRVGWEVKAGHFIGIDRNLYDAAKSAIDASAVG